MFVVNVFSNEDGELRDTLLVAEGDPRKFKKEWDRTVGSLEAENPDDWGVYDVIEALRTKGWAFAGNETIEVAY